MTAAEFTEPFEPRGDPRRQVPLPMPTWFGRHWPWSIVHRRRVARTLRAAAALNFVIAPAGGSTRSRARR